MKVLYLCQVVPYPLESGAKIRVYYTLRHLAKAHEISLLSFNRPDDRPEALTHLRELCQTVHTIPMRRSLGQEGKALLRSLAQRRPLVIGRDTIQEMQQEIFRLLAADQFGAVHADQLYMAQYGLLARQTAGMRSLRLILDKHNTDFLIFQRLARAERNPLKRLLYEREWRKLKRFEASVLAQFDHIVTVTDEDRLTLQSLLEPGKRPPFTTIPICVDTAEAQPVKPAEAAKDVLHLGTMFWPPNVEGVLWFAREVWQRVQAQVPEARFTIVGKNPPQEVRALGTSGEQQGGIEVTGYVADPRPYLERAGVFIVPLFAGSGMRVKILDAWRWGLPVVSTSIGAEGIRYRDGENILVADGAEAFAEAVLKLLGDQSLNRALRLNGRQWVEEHYDWRRVYPAWDQIYAA